MPCPKLIYRQSSVTSLTVTHRKGVFQKEIYPPKSPFLEVRRFGFNGMEKDDEIKGEGNHYDLGFRHYDPRLGRMFSIDPLTAKYPSWSPYQYAGNSPIRIVDVLGLGPGDDDTDLLNGEFKDGFGGIMTYEDGYTDDETYLDADPLTYGDIKSGDFLTSVQPKSPDPMTPTPLYTSGNQTCHSCDNTQKVRGYLTESVFVGSNQDLGFGTKYWADKSSGDIDDYNQTGSASDMTDAIDAMKVLSSRWSKIGNPTSHITKTKYEGGTVGFGSDLIKYNKVGDQFSEILYGQKASEVVPQLQVVKTYYISSEVQAIHQYYNGIVHVGGADSTVITEEFSFFQPGDTIEVVVNTNTK